MANNIELRIRPPGTPSNLLAMWSKTWYLSFLSLSFLICELRIIRAPISRFLRRSNRIKSWRPSQNFTQFKSLVNMFVIVAVTDVFWNPEQRITSIVPPPTTPGQKRKCGKWANESKGRKKILKLNQHCYSSAFFLLIDNFPKPISPSPSIFPSMHHSQLCRHCLRSFNPFLRSDILLQLTYLKESRS